ncbi:protein phosphatase 2C domain-containing protein [Bacillus cereus]|uniref:protein phosphatase 2C domain-containing protein n=1 Tax=Bacillus cereus TaxID=1396 RepID=UPI000E6AE240|nr:protein phosphatase 2C domain-containing protein [Bacillus cereus]
MKGDTVVKIKTYQQKSPLKQECEDSYFCNKEKKIYGVCDGATPLVPFRDEKGHNGAYIASHLFASYFTALRENHSLQFAVAKANEVLQSKMLEYEVDTRKKEHLWCTCIAAVQIVGEKIEYAQLGDCMIVATFQNGTMQVVTKDTVEGISKRAKKKREDDRKKGLSVPEEYVFQDVREQLKYNRYLANMPNGYSVANGMKEAIHYLQHGELHTDEVSGIFICSDGLFHPDWSLEQTVAYIRKNSINEYIAIIEELEAEKRIRPDDKTIIMIDF